MSRKHAKIFGLAFVVLMVLSIVPMGLSAQSAGPRIGMAAREITNDYNRDIIAGAQRVDGSRWRHVGRRRRSN